MMELVKKMKNSTQRVVLIILITSASGNALHVMLEKQMHASYRDAMAVV